MHLFLVAVLAAAPLARPQAPPVPPDENPVASRARAYARDALAKAASLEAAAPLIRLHTLLPDVDDLNLLAEPYAMLLGRPGVNREVRHLARLFFADVEQARGRTTRGGEALEPLGFISDFYAAGGFDNEGKGGCDTDFGPEGATDLKATYPGKGREVRWRKVPARTASGFVELSTLLRPNSSVVAYALTFLQADAETRVNLGLGTSGAYRLFVNGAKVSSSDAYHTPQVDQARVQVHLRRGLNRVLLKVCQESGPLGFYLRQERAEGAPVAARVTLPEAVPPLERGTPPLPMPMPTLTDGYAALIKGRPNDAALRSDYATVLGYTRAFDERELTASREAAKASAAKSDDAELHLRAAGLDSQDFNERRRHLAAALKLEPRSPWTRLAMAQHELAQEHPEVALPMFEALSKDHPRLAQAWLGKARCLEVLGQKPSALNVVEEAFSRMPHVPSVAREAGAQSRKMDRLDEAEGRMRTTVALRFDDTGVRGSLATLLADMGKVDAATEQLEHLLVLDPYDNAMRLRLAELYAANGNGPKAATTFAAARTFAPEEPEVYEREGRALLQSGKRDEALQAFQESLKLRPQNPALKEALRALQGQDAAPGLTESFTVPALAKELPKSSSEDAIYLADVTAVRVQSSGLSSRFHQVAVKVLNDRGVESFRQWPITYSPDRQEVRVLKARITKSDGSVVDSYGDQDQHMNEPWTGMYYDARARVLSFPALTAGDTLELQWRVEDTAAENLLSDYFGDVDSVQATYPKLRYRYVVEMPKERPLYWNKATLPSWLTTAQVPKDGRVVWRFEASNVPKLVPEPNMPGMSEVAATLHVSTYQTWDQVGRYWWGLVKDQLTPNDELNKTVDTVLKGVDRKDTTKVVQAIYGFVVTNTRYVALEFGIHGYKPYRVDRVLARRFGDCKDKASLIVAMLKVAGVDARLVLLRMRNLGALTSEPASLAAFNHAIAYVPALDLFLDGTAEFHGTHDLPSADRVADVLVVEPLGQSRFMVTPEAKPEDNVSALDFTVSLAPDGSAEVKGETVVTGQGAPEYRRSYQSAGARKATFEQQWAQSFPGLSVTSLTASDTTRLEEPMKLQFQLRAPRYAEVLPLGLRFFPLGAGRAFTQVLAPLGERKTDVEFPGVWVNRFTVRYQPPPGYTAQSLPEDFSETTDFGRASLKVRMENGKPLVTAEVVMTKARITAAEYPKFRAWLLRVDQAFSRKLTVVTTGNQSAAR
jgi:tetratricopeptide (TPR) repeat protein/transglutaminase-like putative cysteine protease